MKDKKFEQLLRRKLDGLETPPPPDVWERIASALAAQHLQAPGSKSAPITPRGSLALRLRPWVWTSAGAVAAACALMFVVQRAEVTDAPAVALAADSLPAVHAMAPSAEGPVAESAPSGSMERALASVVPDGAVRKAGRHTVGMAPEEVCHATAAPTSPTMAMAEISPSAVSSGETSETAESSAAPAVSAQRAAPQTPAGGEAAPQSLSRRGGAGAGGRAEKAMVSWGDDTPARTPKFRNGVSASLHVSGNAFGQQGTNDPVLRPYSTVMQHPEVGGASEPLQKSEASGNVHERHLPPFLFGLDLSFPITPRLALETGVSYSILASTCSQTLPPATVHQQAHFVGFPLRALVGVYSRNAWDVYIGAGGKFERCVAVHTDSPDGIAGSDERPSQWSLQLSVGLQRRISSHAACYLEPGFGYYFDNHSALRTAYGERPVNFSLKMGLRFHIGGK